MSDGASPSFKRDFYQLPSGKSHLSDSSNKKKGSPQPQPREPKPCDIFAWTSSEDDDDDEDRPRHKASTSKQEVQAQKKPTPSKADNSKAASSRDLPAAQARPTTHWDSDDSDQEGWHEAKARVAEERARKTQTLTPSPSPSPAKVDPSAAEDKSVKSPPPPSIPPPTASTGKLLSPQEDKPIEFAAPSNPPPAPSIPAKEAASAVEDKAVKSPPPPSATTTTTPPAPLPSPNATYMPGGGSNVPFYQWWSNLGYCGEVSLIQAGLSFGQWISQYNARCLATGFDASVAQTGVKEGKPKANNFAQILLDDDPQEGENVFSTAASNFGLVASNFDSKNQPTGQAGYEFFMQWIKKELAEGNRVTIGVVNDNSGRQSYSHIVSVVRFDTASHGSRSYDGNDVLFIDDHGMMTSGSNPAIPLGTAASGSGETSFVFMHKLADWPSKVTETKPFAIPLPTKDNKNYGTSISGIKDTKKETFPVSLSFTTSNSCHPICEHRYEAPYIGSSDTGSSVTNIAPAAQVMNMTATIYNLTPGQQYNIFTYKWTERPLPRGPLPVPSCDFNNSSPDKTTSCQRFTASGPTHQLSFVINSSDTIVLRAISAGLDANATTANSQTSTTAISTEIKPPAPAPAASPVKAAAKVAPKPSEDEDSD